MEADDYVRSVVDAVVRIKRAQQLAEDAADQVRALRVRQQEAMAHLVTDFGMSTYKAEELLTEALRVHGFTDDEIRVARISHDTVGRAVARAAKSQ